MVYEYDKDKHDVGDLVYAERRKTKMDQKDFSIATGMSITTISRIENGHIDCRLSQLRKIADALGKDFKVVFIDKND